MSASSNGKRKAAVEEDFAMSNKKRKDQYLSSEAYSETLLTQTEVTNEHRIVDQCNPLTRSSKEDVGYEIKALGALSEGHLDHDTMAEQSFSTKSKIDPTTRPTTTSDQTQMGPDVLGLTVESCSFQLPSNTLAPPIPTLVKKPGRKAFLANQSQTEPSETTFNAWINILIHGDLDRAEGPWEMASLDTGAENCVMFEKRLKKLNLAHSCYYGKDLGTYTGLGRGEVKIIGQVHIKFTFEDSPDEIYDADVDVLEDDPDDTKSPPFNILIGRPTINRYDLVKPNRSKMPKALWVRKSSKK